MIQCHLSDMCCPVWLRKPSICFFSDGPFHTCKLQFLLSAIFGLISIIQHDMRSFWNNVANPKVEDLSGGKPSAILLNSILPVKWSIFWVLFNKSSGSNFGRCCPTLMRYVKTSVLLVTDPNVRVFQQMLKQEGSNVSPWNAFAFLNAVSILD